MKWKGPWNEILWDLVIHAMHFLDDCEWHKSGNLEISWDFMKDILEHKDQKLWEYFQMTMVNVNSTKHRFKVVFLQSSGVWLRKVA